MWSASASDPSCPVLLSVMTLHRFPVLLSSVVLPHLKHDGRNEGSCIIQCEAQRLCSSACYVISHISHGCCYFRSSGKSMSSFHAHVQSIPRDVLRYQYSIVVRHDVMWCHRSTAYCCISTVLKLSTGVSPMASTSVLGPNTFNWRICVSLEGVKQWVGERVKERGLRSLRQRGLVQHAV